ncbi:DsbA family oxidoreductase [Aliiglaciecola sp. LCG003]|uniref:DsbA family oxidoreductase n=1 Tax=Aliiglaciecola sp. LCG003 TaxID=3053655 RepID=UPI00257366AC|nr:DsbA family oxidoreductase [Aliiglaciecola sp. LCG003]WJG08882.1 DsbA family oxidoreductase [Aliiglaciecola sp. LCG003]
MKNLSIDIVSDISCPWCIIGYKGLQGALANLSDQLSASITWHPFELNPDMPPQGQEINEHITQKYGISSQQAQQNREMIKQRGLSVGYEFGNRGGGRIYNTFDAHRLLHWAAEQHKQTELKLALFDLYFKQNGNPSDHQQLLDTVAAVGLDVDSARQVLSSDQFSQHVRAEQQHNHKMGISSVPAFIINKKYLISGGQPVETFESALQEIANKEADEG